MGNKQDESYTVDINLVHLDNYYQYRYIQIYSDQWWF